MEIFIWSLSSVAAGTLLVYAAIPIARAIRNIGKLHDLAEEMYPGDKARQANFRDKVASDLLRANPGLRYESREFRALYEEEMDRRLEEYRS